MRWPLVLGLAHQVDHRLVGVERLEVDLAEAVELGPVPELGLQCVAELPQEVDLGELPLLELVERVAAILFLDPGHRLAELLERDAGLVLDGGEGLDEGSGEHPAEVRDDGRDPGRLAHARQSR